MISIDDSSHPLSSDLAVAPGGFGWWYLDWIGPGGESVVVIPSFGLPFLPGSASASRAGRGTHAGAMPSLNLAVTRGDRSELYLLQRYAPEDARWSGNAMQLGRSRFESELVDGRRRFRARIDCPLPGTADRLTGAIDLDAAAVRLPDGPGEHRWSPLGVGPGQVELQVGGRPLVSGVGRAYHDRNGSPVPLHALGIAHWIWSRAPFEDGDLVTYWLWPEGGGPPVSIAWFLGLDGRTRAIDGAVERVGPRLGWFGMPWWSEVRHTSPEGTWRIRHRRVVDDGPFYLRFHTEVVAPDGTVAHGVGEAVRPDRVDRALHRPLVRMAVHDLAGPNSFWLPLFAGLRSGRWGRLFRRDAALLAVGRAS